MIQLNDDFLVSVGLDAMTDEEKVDFLRSTYDELQLRVGTALSEGLSTEQMLEFESFVDKNMQKVNAWFKVHLPNYAEQKDYQQLIQTADEAVTEDELLCEYGSLKWLELNRPNYRQTVSVELEKLRAEIRRGSSAALSEIRSTDQ